MSPLQTSVGNDIDLFSAAEDLDGDNIHYLWIGTGGSFDPPKFLEPGQQLEVEIEGIGVLTNTVVGEVDHD